MWVCDWLAWRSTRQTDRQTVLHYGYISVKQNWSGDEDMQQNTRIAVSVQIWIRAFMHIDKIKK